MHFNPYHFPKTCYTYRPSYFFSRAIRMCIYWSFLLSALRVVFWLLSLINALIKVAFSLRITQPPGRAARPSNTATACCWTAEQWLCWRWWLNHLIVQQRPWLNEIKNVGHHPAPTLPSSFCSQRRCRISSSRWSRRPPACSSISFWRRLISAANDWMWVSACLRLHLRHEHCSDGAHQWSVFAMDWWNDIGGPSGAVGRSTGLAAGITYKASAADAATAVVTSLHLWIKMNERELLAKKRARRHTQAIECIG